MFVMDNAGTGDAATNGGGGVFQQAGTLTMIGVMVDDNSATGTAGSGGGLFVADGVQASVTGGSISRNAANRAGGGIEIANDPMADGVALLTLDRVSVNENVIAIAAPGNGGGIHSGGGTLVIKGGTVSANSAVEGGGVWSNGVVTIMTADNGEDTQISANSASGDEATKGGGGVYAESGAAFDVSGAIIAANAATGTSGSGGGVFIADGAGFSMSDGTITTNTANRAGGGIEVADDGSTDAATVFSLTRVNVTGNSIETANPGNGGGLHIGGAGSAAITQSAFVDNSANEGGGLWVSGGGILNLSLSTVSGNEATAAGGGVYDNGDGGLISLSSVTVADNEAATGGGIFTQDASAGDTFTIANSIISDNDAATGANCAGPTGALIRSVGPSILGALDQCTLVSSDIDRVIFADPLLDELMDNGGRTFTHALRAASPAIDAGVATFAMDQRGFMRAGAADIGAFERGAASPTCAPGSPVAFGDFDAGDDQFVTLRASEAQLTDLTGCTFAVYDIANETIGYTETPNGSVSTGRDFRFGGSDSDDSDLPSGTLRPERGALLLFSGDVSNGDAVTDADLTRIVAAKVYDGSQVILEIAGGATPQQQQQLRAALSAIFTSVEGTTGTIDLALTAQPNPAREGAIVGFGVESTQRVVVTVYDMLGRSVAVIADQTFSPGRYTADLNASRMASGLYVIRIEAGDRVETTRLTVVR